jgi:ribosomal protein S20
VANLKQSKKRSKQDSLKRNINKNKLSLLKNLIKNFIKTFNEKKFDKSKLLYNSICSKIDKYTVKNFFNKSKSHRIKQRLYLKFKRHVAQW